MAGKRAPRNWRARFLEVLASTSNVTASAQAAGVDRTTAYKARKAKGRTAERFREAWDEAMDAAKDRLLAEAWRRAVSGTERPVFQGGKHVGSVKEYSDRLLETLLRAHMPEMFSERYRLEHSGPAGGPIVVDDPREDLVDQLVQMAERLEQAQARKGEADGSS